MTPKWRKMAELYRRFGKDFPHFDWSDEAALAMFNHESHGTPVSLDNGFAVGKKWMDVTVGMWCEDIPKGLLRRSELEADGFDPNWLDRVLK